MPSQPDVIEELYPDSLEVFARKNKELAELANSLIKDFKAAFEVEAPGSYLRCGVLYHKLAFMQEIMEDYVKENGLSEKDVTFMPIFKATAGKSSLYQRAEKCYRKALEMNPEFTEAHYNLAVILRRHGNSAAAVGHFQFASKEQPHPQGFPHAYLNANAFWHLAEMFDDTNESFLAEPNYRDALTGQSNFGPYHVRFAEFLRKNGQLDEAMEQFDRTMPYSHRYTTEFVVPDFEKADELAKQAPPSESKKEILSVDESKTEPEKLKPQKPICQAHGHGSFFISADRLEKNEKEDNCFQKIWNFVRGK